MGSSSAWKYGWGHDALGEAGARRQWESAKKSCGTAYSLRKLKGIIISSLVGGIFRFRSQFLRQSNLF